MASIIMPEIRIKHSIWAGNVHIKVKKECLSIKFIKVGKMVAYVYAIMSDENIFLHNFY